MRRGDDCRACVDYELPVFAVVEDRSRDGPNRTKVTAKTKVAGFPDMAATVEANLEKPWDIMLSLMETSLVPGK